MSADRAPYQALPDLSPAEYEALRDGMKANGYDPAHPVVVDESGDILDGHHRARAAAECGIEAPTVVLPGLTEAQKVEYAIRANCQRRHLTSEQKRQVIAAELARDPGRSDRAIASLIGVDHKTVGSVRRGEFPHLADELDRAARELVSRALANYQPPELPSEYESWSEERQLAYLEGRIERGLQTLDEVDMAAGVVAATRRRIEARIEELEREA